MGRVSGSSRGLRLVAGCAVVALLALVFSLMFSDGPVGRAHADDLVCTAFGGGPPYAFETYEASRDRDPYLTAQRLAAQGLLFPDDDPFALQPIEAGPFGSRKALADASIPVELLHAIGWIESRLNQGSIEVPYEGVGPVLTSASCAYGLMQVASFFSNEGAAPSRSESLVGTHYAYNVAAGAQILVDKWNLEFFPQVGASNPAIVESWYYATWAYNGWALANHPAGPEVDPFRTPYDCEGPFNGYPFQELVWGCLANPPSVDGVRLWDPMLVGLPDVAALSGAGGPLDPDVYFDGWALVFAAPFSGDDASTPFAGMNLPMPGAALVVRPPLIPESTAAALRASILGTPALEVEESFLELVAGEKEAESGSIHLRNSAAGLLVYRLVPLEGWIGLDVAAGVVVGSGFPLGDDQPRTVVITVTPDAEGLPEGLHQGSIIVEAILPNGEVVATTVVVVVDKQGVPRYRAGTPIS